MIASERMVVKFQSPNRSVDISLGNGAMLSPAEAVE
jgi:hypothetical protein